MINNRFKRLLSMLMCVVMCVVSPCTSVFAYTDAPIDEIVEDDSEELWDCFTEDEAEDEDLLTGYMLQEAETVISDADEVLIREDDAEVYVERGSLLTGAEKTCYDVMKEQIRKIAAGTVSSSQIYVPIPDEYLHEYTAEMLGVENIYDTEITKAAKDALKAVVDIDMKRVVRSLMLDMPYELYWFDKTVGYSKGFVVAYRYRKINGIETLSFATPSSYSVPAIRFSFTVAEAYRCGTAKDYTFNWDLAAKARSAAEKAAEDVIRINNSVSSDYAKLYEYKKLIQNYSEYNHAALSNGTPYGDPWQMIYVFDDDPSTKVVCEGFSKAFKFMCDISSFAGDINCYLVSGFMGGTGGQHMWNNVRMEDGKIYLVDVTNSRGDAAVNFLGGAEYKPGTYITPTSSADGTYRTYAYYCGYNYFYDKLTLSLYDDDILRYSTAAYDTSQNKETRILTLSMNYADGGSKMINVYKDEDLRTRLAKETAVRDGYAFKGWYTTSDNSVDISTLDGFSVNDNDTVVYAGWRSLQKYNVTAYSVEGHFNNDSTSQNAMMCEGQSYYQIFEVPEYKEHYYFTGWYEDESRNAESLIPLNATFEPDRSREIYAGYSLKKYELTLDPCGGIFSDGSASPKVFSYDALSIPAEPVEYIPLKEGYEFTGWYTKKNGGQAYDFTGEIRVSFTLYARYTEKAADPVETPSDNKPEKPDTVSVNGFYACFDDDIVYKDKYDCYHAEYRGEKLTPAVKVYDNRTLLREGEDYTVRYVNNLNTYYKSGRVAYAEIKGKANFTGTYRLEFVIDRKDISTLLNGNLCVKEGSESKADPVLLHNGKKLVSNKDYYLEINGYTAELNGSGNYTCSMKLELTKLNASEYSEKSIKLRLLAPEFIYDGKEKYLKDGSELIVSDKKGNPADYVVTYSSNVNAGTVRVTVCGSGNNHGCIKKTFRIKPCKLKGPEAFEVKYTDKLSYKAGGSKPEDISVKCLKTGEVLTEGRDIRYTYSNYKKSGNGKVRLTFKGNYKGSSYDILKYSIEKRSLDDATVYAGSLAYTKPGTYKPKVIVTCNGSFVNTKEYKAEYNTDLKADSPQKDLMLSVTSKEKNYTGSSGVVSYNISTSGIDINKSKIIFIAGADKQYYEGHGEAVTLRPGVDFKLKISKDLIIDDPAELHSNFRFIYTDNEKKGAAHIIVIPTSERYIGVTSARFRIKARTLT